MLAHLAMFPLINDSIVRLTLKRIIGLGPVANLRNSRSVVLELL